MDALRRRLRLQHAQSVCVFCTFLLAGVTSTPIVAHADQVNIGHPFQLFGSASLRSGPPTQAANNFQLTASLSASAAGTVSRAAPAGEGYEMTAKLAFASLVCASDTIFVNGFDG